MLKHAKDVGIDVGSVNIMELCLSYLKMDSFCRRLIDKLNDLTISDEIIKSTNKVNESFENSLSMAVIDSIVSRDNKLLYLIDGVWLGYDSSRSTTIHICKEECCCKVMHDDHNNIYELTSKEYSCFSSFSGNSGDESGSSFSIFKTNDAPYVSVNNAGSEYQSGVNESIRTIIAKFEADHATENYLIPINDNVDFTIEEKIISDDWNEYIKYQFEELRNFYHESISLKSLYILVMKSVEFVKRHGDSKNLELYSTITRKLTQSVFKNTIQTTTSKSKSHKIILTSKNNSTLKTVSKTKKPSSKNNRDYTTTRISIANSSYGKLYRMGGYYQLVTIVDDLKVYNEFMEPKLLKGSFCLEQLKTTNNPIWLNYLNFLNTPSFKNIIENGLTSISIVANLKCRREERTSEEDKFIETAANLLVTLTPGLIRLYTEVLHNIFTIFKNKYKAMEKYLKDMNQKKLVPNRQVIRNNDWLYFNHKEYEIILDDCLSLEQCLDIIEFMLNVWMTCKAVCDKKIANELDKKREAFIIGILYSFENGIVVDTRTLIPVLFSYRLKDLK